MIRVTTSTCLRSVLVAASALAAAAPMAVRAADWSDTFIGYTYGTKFRQPGSDADVTKNVATLQYVGGYKYGVNFFTVDMLKSDHNNPAAGPTSAGSTRGGQEVYVSYNNTLSWGKLSGAPFKFGPVRDLGFQAGFDFNSQNDAFGSGLIKLIAGPKLDLDVPGLLTLGLFYYKEWNNNAIVGKNVNFDAAPRIGTVWAFDVNAGLPAQLKGWANWTGAKGKDGFGGDTAAETWLEASFLWDVGSLAGHPKAVYAGLGYQYIHNKFGNQATLAGTKVSSPSLQVQVHF
jgi:nucleoside-specific outer membrane channel protein Tsx